MAEQQGGPYGTTEGREIRHDVVNGRNKWLIYDMSDRNDDTTRERHGQEDFHHS